MNKKLMSALFVGALLLGSTSTLSSCKDYDDDIQANTDAIASLKKELSDKISTLENSVKDVQAAKDSAATALKAAQDALATAQGKADSATVAALEKRVADLESQYKTLSEAVKKLQDGNYEDRLAKVEKDLAAAIAAINAGSGSVADLTGIQTQIDGLETELADIIGHRLTSVTFVASSNINGIPAIKFESLKYQDNLKKKPRTGITEKADSIKPDGLIDLYDASGKVTYMTVGASTKTIEYTLNPAPFVKAENITMPYFNCMVAENDIELTKVVDANKAGKNSPIKPDETQKLTVDSKGVLQLKIKKSVTEDMNKDWVNGIKPSTSNDATERFYMAQLVVPIAKAQWTTAEKTAPEVVSDWARISESTISVYIENSSAKGHTTATAANFPTDKDVNNRYVHYHDSLTAYDQTVEKTRVNDIDHYLQYDKVYNLDSLVRVCNIDNHSVIKDYKALGLSFRFHIPGQAKGKNDSIISAPSGGYIIGSNKTDEQMFAKVTGANMLSSMVYKDNLGVSQTSIGRQPIIAAELVDTLNHKTVCLRYIKIKWAKTVALNVLPSTNLPEKVVSCKTLWPVLGTQDMNTDIYHLARVGGMTKEEFHNIYKTMEIKSFTKDGVNVLTTEAASITGGNQADDTKMYYYVSGNNKTNYMLADFTTTAKAENKEPLSGSEPDVVVGLVPDEKDNTSFNLVIRLDPKAIGTVKKGGSEYRLTLTFKDATGANGDLEKTFVLPVVLPTQKFTYQGTYWDGGYRNGVTDYDTYNINPINYSTAYDKLGTTIGAYWNDGILTSIQNTGLLTNSAYSQIRTDLINGYINETTLDKPANVGQLIQDIEECGVVSMVFDAAKFGKYSHLTGYTVYNETNSDGSIRSVLRDDKINPLEVWKNTKTNDGYPNSTASAVYQGTDAIYYQEPAIAGWIDSRFGVTALQNKKSNAGQLPYYDIALGTKTNECTAVLQLAEKDRLHGTTAANALIGKKVPVKLLVAYNAYNVVAEDEFEVKIIEPLKVNGELKDTEFKDNVYDGSWLDARNGYTMTDWNKYEVAAQSTTDYAEALYHFYGVESITWDLDNLKTNLVLSGASYQVSPDPAYNTGKMPTNVSLKAFRGVKGDISTPTTTNPNFLVYYNNDGSPVNATYKIFVNTNVKYKWGVMNAEPVVLKVNKNLEP